MLREQFFQSRLPQRPVLAVLVIGEHAAVRWPCEVQTASQRCGVCEQRATGEHDGGGRRAFHHRNRAIGRFCGHVHVLQGSARLMLVEQVLVGVGVVRAPG